MNGPLQLWEPLLACGGAAFMIYLEIEVAKFVLTNKERWMGRLRSSRSYRWLDAHEPGVRIRSGDDALIIGWMRP